jgi:tRNA(adenine34) deaminase
MSDEDFMKIAIAEADKAATENEIPVGAVAVLNGIVIAADHNRMEQLHDATAHAEILLIRKASSIINDWRLSDITIYVTKEPCVMCGGAMVNAHLHKVVYGLRDPRSGADTLGLLRNPDLLYQVESSGGILEDICKDQFQTFFRKRRQEQKEEKTAKNNS